MYDNPNLEGVAKADPELARAIADRGGFVTEDEIPKLTEISRMLKVLVQCGCGRFTCSVQDVKHFIDIIKRDAEANNGDRGDYVRQVSLVHSRAA